MKCKVYIIAPFDRQLKRLVKKYPSLKDEFARLVNTLEIKPDSGIALGNNCYKIRIGIASKGKGKSGGGRVITYLQKTESSVYLLAIFDKSELQDISNKELYELLKYIPG